MNTRHTLNLRGGPMDGLMGWHPLEVPESLTLTTPYASHLYERIGYPASDGAIIYRPTASVPLSHSQAIEQHNWREKSDRNTAERGRLEFRLGAAKENNDV